MNFIVKILISTLAVLTTCYLLPHSMVYLDGFTTALVLALVLSFLNAVLKPILIILAIPLTIFILKTLRLGTLASDGIFTLFMIGIFFFAINAVIVKVADHYVDGFRVDGWWTAFIFSLVLTIINSIFNSMKKKDERGQ